MVKPAYGGSDPIAALATPLAESALALFRTSGSASNERCLSRNGESPRGAQSAISLLAKIFSRPEKLLAAQGNTLVHGWITDFDSGEKIDEVVVSVYRAPRSYTGEDGADISCHGGIGVVRGVLAALKKAGFRDALPGEFSFRAFMNGKLDLTRAESVMELVAAKTWRSRENAVRRLTGVLEREILAIKALLVEVLAGTEIYLDYSEDEFLNPDGAEETGRLPGRKLAEEAAVRLEKLKNLWRQEKIYREGALVVLAGRPNAGKSSLFNYLIREDRSIVTAAPGTTRDWIEAALSVEGIPVRLADTAGLRDAAREVLAHNALGEAEQIGIQRSMELLDRADLVLYVIDGAEGIQNGDIEFLRRFNERSKPLLVLWNKSDAAEPPSFAGEEFPGALLRVSAKTGENIPGLLRSIARVLEAESSGAETSESGAAGPGSLRQKELIDSALDSVEEALVLAGLNEPLDLIAPLFRSAVNALGEITGEVSTMDILEVMFSRFCVGK